MRTDEKNKSLEADIKATTLNYLIQQGYLKTSDPLINEFTICNFSRRVDLVWIKKNKLYAFEIKSESDSLDRLQGQISKYLEYFDKVVIVAASKHISKIKRNVPKNIAIWEFSEGHIQVVQQGRIVHIKDKCKVLNIMKASELFKLSNRLGFSLSSRNRSFIEGALVKASLTKLKQAMIENLIKRYKITCDIFWQTVRGQRIKSEHISLLSPYQKERLLQKTLQKKNRIFWSNLSTMYERNNFMAMLKNNNNIHLFGSPPKQIEQLLAT